eukprot:1160012-Pelagomonas_calceolata.AAC.3
MHKAANTVRPILLALGKPANPQLLLKFEPGRVATLVFHGEAVHRTWACPMLLISFQSWHRVSKRYKLSTYLSILTNSPPSGSTTPQHAEPAYLMQHVHKCAAAGAGLQTREQQGQILQVVQVDSQLLPGACPQSIHHTKQVFLKMLHDRFISERARSLMKQRQVCGHIYHSG